MQIDLIVTDKRKMASVRKVSYALEPKYSWDGMLHVKGNIEISFMNGEKSSLSGRFPYSILQDHYGVIFQLQKNKKNG
jgi:hypothetical protein